MKSIVSAIILSMVILTAGIAHAEVEVKCESESGSDAIEEPIFPNGLVTQKTWDNKAKRYRAILKNGDMVFIAYSFCVHMGMEASLILTDYEKNPKALAQHADWFASLVLSKEDLATFRKGVQGKEFVSGKTNFMLEDDTYDSFRIGVTGYGSLTIITITYYFAL